MFISCSTKQLVLVYYDGDLFCNAVTTYFYYEKREIVNYFIPLFNSKTLDIVVDENNDCCVMTRYLSILV